MKYRKFSGAPESFTAKGYRRAEFFNHSVAVIPKQYPDTYLLLHQRGFPEPELRSGVFYQLNLYSSDLFGFPDDLFTHPMLNWHNQQLGERGLIAAAGLYIANASLTITVMQSDICQQLYRHNELKRACKTQLEKRFSSWPRILLNAILDFALEQGCSSVCVPTAEWILASTKKRVQPGLFSRIYDAPAAAYESRIVNKHRAEHRQIPIPQNAHRIVRLEARALTNDLAIPAKTVCLFHDIEENIDTRISQSECAANLENMLAIEKSCGVRATYNIVGHLLPIKRRHIKASNSSHSVAFHSFDHDLADLNQLKRCREVDLQVRGYRPPQSVITSELTDYNLSFFNFEWLASGERSIGSTECLLRNGLVKIPIAIDDYPLFTGQLNYSDWERRLIASIQSRSFVALGLHDCYGQFWLPNYADLLAKLGSLATFVTADDLCDRIYREHEVSRQLTAEEANRESAFHSAAH